MRIGIDIYPLTRKIKTGIGYYLYYLLKNLLEIDDKNDYILYNNSGKEIELKYPNLYYSDTSSGNILNKFSTAWMILGARKQLIKDKIDIFWGTHAIIPPNLPDSIKTLLNIHDLTISLGPGTMSLGNFFIHNFLFKKSVLKAKKIIVISNTTADALKSVFNNKGISDKISIIYDGIDTEKFKQSDADISKKYVSHKFDILADFILFVGTIEPRKNISGLLKAFKILKTKYGVKQQLVLAGGMGWKTTSIFKVCKRLSFGADEVKFLGYVKEEDLIKLYCAANIFVFPSLYEGFGFPPLEAMSSGTPVIASAIPVFREILGEAAVLADPHNPDDIALKIYEVISNVNLRNSLVHKGLERARLFSWTNTARQTLSVLEEVNSKK